MECRNARYNAYGSIDCEVAHPDFGWIPFTASADDAEPHGRAIYEAASQMDVAPYEAPEPLPPLTPELTLAAMPAVSHAQMIAALILAEIITEAEGVAWISGTLPDAVEVMLAALPADQQVIARLRAIRPSSVVPTDPLVAALAAAQGQGVEDLISLFQTAAAL